MASNKFIGLLFALFLNITSTAQTPTKYWVKFINKNNSIYSISNPNSFLSARSIARRANQGITLNVTDLPVNQSYVNQVSATGAQVFQTSKWFNAAVVIITNTLQLTAINNLTCVVNSNPVGKYYSNYNNALSTTKNNNNQFQKTQATTAYNYGGAFTQVNQIGVDCMHDAGFRGQGIVIAVLDAGFDNANNNAVFDSLRNEGRILGTRDYVAGNTSVYEDFHHGAEVLSTIVGNSPGNLIGTGPKASVYLCRTEDVASEKPIEESNWIVAAEYADSVGADIITTSLGYTSFDSPFTSHIYADLNGQTSNASIASTMASRKGMFICSAAGNDGGNAWNYISVPADADSICTVGSVNGVGVHSAFSSIGPTSDGRIKPDLSTRGEGSFVCVPNGGFTGSNGTSFATPIMAGAVACLWQANPTKTNMQLLQALKATASLSISPNNNYGWGIPNICAAHNLINGTTLGVKQLNSAYVGEFKLFPNPFISEITIQSKEAITNITITDMLGNAINYDLFKSNLNYTITINKAIANGVYFVIVTTTNGSFKNKLIKV